MDSTNGDINYILANQAKTEYGLICMKEKKNKYGQIKRDFAKSNKSFQNLCSKDDAESMFWYEYFLEYRCRGIRVDLEQAFQLYNIKNRMN